MKCMQVQKYLHAHIDGELGADLSLEIEKHLAECGRCREQMDFEVSFIDRIRSEMRVSDHDAGLEDSIRKALEKDDRRRTNVRRFSQISVLALAASVILVVGILIKFSVEQPEELPPIGFSDEVVKQHTRNMPLEISNGSEVEVAKWFEGKVDFPVQPPSFANEANARLVGARLSRIKDKDAAQLEYEVNGHRMTFVIFDPGLDDKTIENEKVTRRAKDLPHNDGWVTTNRGYSVGVFRQRGIAYTLTSDVEEGDIIELISYIHH